ncbi:hypothetical protein VTO73DRAFT_12192 [Trametes versicolor]
MAGILRSSSEILAFNIQARADEKELEKDIGYGAGVVVLVVIALVLAAVGLFKWIARQCGFRRVPVKGLAALLRRTKTSRDPQSDGSFPSSSHEERATAQVPEVAYAERDESDPFAALPTLLAAKSVPAHTDEDLRSNHPSPRMLHRAGETSTADASTSYDHADRMSWTAQPKHLQHPARTLKQRRTSLASTGRDSLISSGGEDGYGTDMTTMSTLPPSYRRHRSIPDVPSLPTSPPIPSTPNVSAEVIFSPPPAFVRSGRRIQRHHPKRAGSATRASRRYASASSERRNAIPVPGVGESGQLRRGFGDAENVEVSRGYQPRKSADGGVRLAGGPPDMPAEEAENPFEAYAYETASMISAPSYHTEF